jgi:hypothetical protein
MRPLSQHILSMLVEEITRVAPKENPKQGGPGKRDSLPGSDGKKHRDNGARSCC